MMNIRKILFATDFSEASEPALRVAASLARDNRADLILLHVSRIEDYPLGELVDEAPEAPRGEVERLEELAASVENVSCDYRWVHCDGPHEADAIVKAAAEESADLIVVGTHGRRGLSHLLAGSVAEKVIREAECPVLTVRQMKTSAATTQIKNTR
jgi:nucleotide-binding universal stress UspA family protein